MILDMLSWTLLVLGGLAGIIGGLGIHRFLAGSHLRMTPQ